MRKTLFLGVVVLLVLFVSVSSVLADKEAPKDAKTAVTAANPPATITINAAAKKQPAVVFSHEKHIQVVKTCETCHHTNKGLTAASKVKVEKCSSCHMQPKGKMAAMGDASLQKNPLHANCIGCHKAEKKGPVMCVKCHVKK